MTTPAQAFRAPMRSRRDDIADDGAAVERALAQDLCGMGGVLTDVPRTLDDAIDATAREHDDRAARRLERFALAPDGALVWTRDADGELWLGALDGPWRYDSADSALAVDLVHVRPCRWLGEPVPPAAVPAPVHVAFARGGLNWQGIRPGRAGELSAQLWRERTSTRGL
ncbi:GAF domain-containing protein [Demequina sp. NBRC 110053]|uniref:GAF domain-containing protein n=1 Tax=Demequina sp. NBRC 110053 TaxID=1570342 RepID=UPI000A034407|nr:GAF domain-containing protein [Demequina sp. NBRC 110053]